MTNHTRHIVRHALLLAISAVTVGLPDPLWAQAASAQGTAATNAPTCIAIVLPSARGIDGDATQFSSSLRDLFMSYLTGPSLRAIELEARLESQALEEARQKDCAYLLLTSVTRKRDDGNGVGRALGRAAGAAAWYGVPYGGGAAGAAARSAAIAGAYAISNMADTTREKDEVTIEFRIGPVETALGVTPRSEKAKARRHGEDLLTPLVEKVSEQVANTVLKP